ncbi:MAG: hypothetical protein FJ149_12020 [Euryarchaeota archaeon]|nr:hypothetical protein [Euryarchaeota archaeon]
MHRNLPFTVWNLLREFDPDRKGYLSATRFYKASYLLHRKLKQRRIQTGLPWCWYIYGPEVRMDLIPAEIYIREERPDGTRYYFGAEPGSQEPEPGTRAPILYEIRALHKKRLGTGDMVREIYKNPPKKMLSLLKEYEDLVDSLEQGQTLIGGDLSALMLARLDRIERSYSEEDFGEMYAEFLRLDDLLRLLLRDRPERIRQLGGTIHSFRELVATKASALFNENLPEGFAGERMELMRRRLEAFRPGLDALEKNLLKDIPRKDGDRRHTAGLARAASIVTREESE